jgi:hypothetical protein
MQLDVGSWKIYSNQGGGGGERRWLLEFFGIDRPKVKGTDSATERYN